MKLFKSPIVMFGFFSLLIGSLFSYLYMTDHVERAAISPFFSLVLALMAFWGLIIIRRKIIKLSKKKKKKEAVITFSINLFFGIAVSILTIPVLSEFGVPTASMVTILGTSSLAIGLALKNFLANIAAGIMLIFQKPFDIGELVDVSGKVGKVTKIDLFSVTIKTPNNELVYIPNGKLISDKIINKTHLGQRRLDLTISISYDSNIKKAKELILEVITANNTILIDPAPVIAVDNLADSGVELAVRVWVDNQHFGLVKWYLLENIKTTFDDNGIILPFPQMKVWISKDE